MDGENWNLFNRRILVKVLKTCQTEFSVAFHHIQPDCFHRKQAVNLEVLPTYPRYVQGHTKQGGWNITNI